MQLSDGVVVVIAVQRPCAFFHLSIDDTTLPLSMYRINRLSSLARSAQRQRFLQCVRQCLNLISLQRPFRRREPNSRRPDSRPFRSPSTVPKAGGLD